MPLPPLVEPGPPLDPDQATRWSRHLLLPEIGALGQRRLQAARVLVVGAGGLGSPVLQYLAAAGVGTIGVVDDDVVDPTNLQRQVVHGTADVGRPKVTSAAEAVRRIDPSLVVHEHRLRLDATNALDVLSGYDLVLDGTDRFASRYLVADACEILGLPVVWGAVLRFDGQISLFWSRPPRGCGLPAVVYRDVFPQPPADGSVPSCAEAGVLGVVCAAVGAAMATEAVRLITGVGEPLLGRMLVLDALTSRWREVPLRPDPHRVPVTALHDLPSACVLPGPDDPDLLAAERLAQRLVDRARGADDFDLVDVRTAEEHAGIRVPGSRSVPLDRFRDGTAWADLDPDRELVLCCQGGVRSAEALAAARARGFRARHLAGGVLAWIDSAARTTSAP